MVEGSEMKRQKESIICRIEVPENVQANLFLRAIKIAAIERGWTIGEFLMNAVRMAFPSINDRIDEISKQNSEIRK